MARRLPKFIRCSNCSQVFKRGKFVIRMKCPFCKTYIWIYDEGIEFYSWRSNGAGVQKLSKKETNDIINYFKKKYDKSKGAPLQI